MRIIVCVLIAVLLGGCAMAQKSRETMIQEAISRALSSYYNAPSGVGRLYPEPHRYVWDNQILDEIVVPGAIRGGVFYPAHRETIVVKPSEPLLIPEREGTGESPGREE